MNPAQDALINAILAAILALMKVWGMAEEEAKAALTLKIAEIKGLSPLPMNEDK